MELGVNLPVARGRIAALGRFSSCVPRFTSLLESMLVQIDYVVVTVFGSLGAAGRQGTKTDVKLVVSFWVADSEWERRVV
jgi:hypothetical protein